MGTENHTIAKKMVKPIEDFLALESASGILLMLATAVAMIWANSPFYHGYEHFIHTPIGIQFGNFSMQHGLQHWVNDALMVIFFFVVGLEIKMELVIGELSSPRKAALPILAAIGGMIVPALFYHFLNMEGPQKSGWGIPMATDIAFAVGVLTLMSRKVPFALKIFLLALAIVDDLGAILVIAFFYPSGEISTNALFSAAALVVFITVLKHIGVQNLIVYTIVGTLLWFAVLSSGVHATIAGVVLGLLTPLKASYDKKSLAAIMTELAKDISDAMSGKEDHSKPSLEHHTIHKLAKAQKVVQLGKTPLERLVHALHPWVSYVIMPLFALVNAGVHISGETASQFASNSVSIGVIAGLFLGKPIGVVAMCWLAVKTKIAELPQGVTWFQMTAVGCLAGIGFTMALFVGNLALGKTAPELESFAKLAILIASTLAGVLGAGLLFFCKDLKKSN